MASTVVVIPTYCELHNIDTVTARVHAVLPDAAVLVVDDASPDGTGLRADALSRASGGWLHVLHRARKEGLGKAYVAGYLHALAHFPEASFFVQMDADLSHDPRHLPELLCAAQNADLPVLGSRNCPGIRVAEVPKTDQGLTSTQKLSVKA